MGDLAFWPGRGHFGKGRISSFVNLARGGGAFF